MTSCGSWPRLSPTSPSVGQPCGGSGGSGGSSDEDGVVIKYDADDEPIAPGCCAPYAASLCRCSRVDSGGQDAPRFLGGHPEFFELEDVFGTPPCQYPGAGTGVP